MVSLIDIRRVGLIIALLVAASCTAEVAKKPEVASTGQPVAPRAQGRGEGSQQAIRQKSSTSSLDAHQEGKAPSSGPLNDIYFDFDKYDLSLSARNVLKANADWLRANPSASVEIEGHCDERGTTEYNLALGAKRARVAQDYLVSLGVSAARIKTTSYGEELPVCREANEACYQKNRRDRFVDRVQPTS